MAVTAIDLANYVGANVPTDTAFVERCFNFAVKRVTKRCESVLDDQGNIPEEIIPEEILDEAYIAVGAEKFAQRSAPGGVSQYNTTEGAVPIRLARDPMVAAEPILKPYLPGGFA